MSLNSSVMPMTPFIGVRISWLMLARNSLFAALLSSAFCLAAASSTFTAARTLQLFLELQAMALHFLIAALDGGEHLVEHVDQAARSRRSSGTSPAACSPCCSRRAGRRRRAPGSAPEMSRWSHDDRSSETLAAATMMMARMVMKPTSRARSSVRSDSR